MEQEKSLCYVVQSGDTIIKIAKRYNVGIALINRENPFVDIYDLAPGMELYIPVEEIPQQQNLMEVEVKESDTISDILVQYRISLEELLKFNHLDTIKLIPGMKMKLPKRESNSKI